MIKEELLLFVEIEDRAVTVFLERDLGTGVDEKKDAGDPSLKWNKCALFAEAHVYISLYKATLRIKKLRKNKAKQITILKGPESIPYPEEEGHNWIDYLQVKGHWRESLNGFQADALSHDLSPENCVQLCSFLFSRNW